MVYDLGFRLLPEPSAKSLMRRGVQGLSPKGLGFGVWGFAWRSEDLVSRLRTLIMHNVATLFLLMLNPKALNPK